MSRSIDELTRAVLDMPAAIAPEVSQASDDLYRDVPRASAPGEILRDLRYGPHARHRLDLHLPAKPGSGRPLLLFVHGGGYVRGDKSQPGLFYYDNIGAWAASQGVVAAVMTYRLAPEHVWPSGAQDVAAAVEWLAANAEAHGADPGRIFLMGHSAGAAHAACYVAGHGGAGLAEERLSGCVLLSGTYDLVNGTANKVYFGDDPARYAERSSIDALAQSSVPLLLGVAQADPPATHRQFVLVQQAFLGRGRPLPHLLHADGHNHYTIAHHLGTQDECVGRRILDFIEKRLATQETPAP